MTENTQDMRVVLNAIFTTYDGYGSIAEYLAIGMQREGALVDPLPLYLDRSGLSDEFLCILDQSRPAIDSTVLVFSFPSANLDRFQSARELFIYTMWEADRLPAAWPGWINRARAAIVPSRANADVFRNSGVTAPIGVIPLGADPDVYHYLDRPERPGLSTLIVGTPYPRKHIAEGIEAWKAAFKDDPEARLIVKSRFGMGNILTGDPRIVVLTGNDTTRGILHWYREADVLVAIGNEGFGLPAVEGMATGLPVIALNSEGQSDLCEDARDLILPVRASSWQDATDSPFGPGGRRGVPDIAEVTEHLRWVASHRDEARAMGRAASEWAHRFRNVWDAAPRVLDVMERYTTAPRSFRVLPATTRPAAPDP
jgi:glycosyltransferase involved in cell wall biosynthesis